MQDNSVRQCFESNLARLETIWSRIGFAGNVLNGRHGHSSVMRQLQTLFMDMIDEETAREQKTLTVLNITEHKFGRYLKNLHGQPQTAKISGVFRISERGQSPPIFPFPSLLLPFLPLSSPPFSSPPFLFPPLRSRTL